MPAVAGVGFTPFTKASGREVLDLAAEAVENACVDAGLPLTELDGVGSFMVGTDSVTCGALSTALALPGLQFAADLNQAGQAPCHLLGIAADAIRSGRASNIVLFRALNGRSGPRVGSTQFAGRGGQFRYPIGYDAYPMYFAMWARRYLHETGQGPDDLAAVAIAHRQNALRNERAVMRRPLDLDSYFTSPMVADPFRVADCTVEVDGACAIVVTSVERARDLLQPPVLVAATAYRAGARPGLDNGDHVLTDDYSRNFTDSIRDDLFGRAGVVPGDVDIACLYDCFTSAVLTSLEGLGLCPRGGAGAFVRSGQLPINPHGGLLGEGYLHGMNTLAEAVLQIQGRSGDRQATEHDVAVVTSGALLDGSAAILTADR